MEGDVIESIAARIRFATGCSYSTSVEAAAISVNLLKPSHDESKNRIADLEARLATAEVKYAALITACEELFEARHGSDRESAARKALRELLK